MQAHPWRSCVILRSMKATSLPMKYVPNAITFARILITPVIVFLMFSEGFLAALGTLLLFVAAAISDYYDGKLARDYKVNSRLGQFMDPFADKVLVLGTFAALAWLMPATVPWWGVALIALRDVVVTILRSMAEARNEPLRTLPIAKAKTTVQLVFIIAMLLLLTLAEAGGQVQQVANWILESPIPYAMMLITVGFTVLTGLIYLLRREPAP